MARPLARTSGASRAAAQSNHGFDRTELVNRDPDRWYQFIDPLSKEYGLRYYRALGYRVEVKTKGGVRLRHESEFEGDDDMGMGPSPYLKAAEAEHIEFIGQILMSCTKKRHHELTRKGHFGNTGLDYFDMLDREMLKKARIPLEGAVSSDIATFQNETTARQSHLVGSEI